MNVLTNLSNPSRLEQNFQTLADLLLSPKVATWRVRTNCPKFLLLHKKIQVVYAAQIYKLLPENHILLPKLLLCYQNLFFVA